MKKLISIGLMLALAGGLVLAENKRAEALDPASAVLIGASIMLLPILGHISYEHEYYGHAPYYPGAYSAASYDDGYYGGYYANPYPTPTRVYYSAPRQVYYGGSRYERYYGRNWNRDYGYERDGGRHRERYEDRRGHDYDRGRYARRY